jgi:creatinine amidohydrolase
MAQGLARRLAAEIDGALLPPIHYGETWNNEAFPGTISLSFDTVKAIALDISRSLHRAGWNVLVIVNGDFGNQAPLRLAARQAHDELNFPVLIVDYPGLAELAEAICESAPAGPGFYHADEVETSVMLALTPEWVRMDRAVAEYPSFPAFYGATPLSLADVSTTGVFGDPRRADAAKGQRLMDGLTERALQIVRPFLRHAREHPSSPGP